MTPERWRQITEIFHAARSRDSAERDAFVASRCGDDAALRDEVEAMLAADRQARRSDESARVLAAGDRVGPYEVLSFLGMGGMGQVYRARDTKLHRDVAVKVLLPDVADNPDRIARFAREARVLASLNHPNIAQVYGLEESGGVGALVMELVEGRTLADRIARGPIPIQEALQIGRQIAEALEAAHERGIVHRDLKPANVKIRTDGTVKVLDFGLAKALDRSVGYPETSDIGEMPTTLHPGDTVAEVILGTAPYMSPEQAKGRPVDRRTDLWAFGCVMFEMLTGRSPFSGETLREILGRIIEQEPDWNSVPPKTPAPVHKLLRHCLEKDPKRRLDSAAVARIEIDEALAKPGAEPFHPTPPSSQPRRRSISMALATLAIALTGITAGVWLLGNRGNPGVSAVPQLHNPVQVTSTWDVDGYPTWSPDGTRVAYQATESGYTSIATHDIWVAQIGGGEPVKLTKGDAASNRMPSWSPDGREIAFLSNRGSVWGVYTMAAIGGNARLLLSLPGIGNQNWSAPQWSSDGTRMTVSVRQSEENVAIVISLPSLDTTRVVLPGHNGNLCWDLSVSPDGRRFVYVEGTAGNPDVTRLWSIPSSGGESVPLTDGRTTVWSPSWSSDGRKLFYVSNRGGSMDLWQQAVAEEGAPLGEPLAVTQGLGMRSAAFSPDGTKLAYARGGKVANVWRTPIPSDRLATWADAVQVTSERAYIEFVDVSPDGTTLAVSSDRRGNQDIYLLPTEGGELTPLTTDPTHDWNPRWSPDGREIAFYGYRSGNRDIWVVPSRGGPPRQLTSHPDQDWFQAWSPDGGEIAFHSAAASAVSIMPANGGERRLLATGVDPLVEWSPDGRWFLLLRDGRLYRVAREGGELALLSLAIQQAYGARFSRDRRSIYYSALVGRQSQLRKLSLSDGKVSQVTELKGRRGRFGQIAGTDDRYLYFTWNEDDGDIWVMDVAKTGK
jgi:Tol biopolymer transport system component/tRNA A-37 threonylcarbamoyl transferase component Bud32